MKLATNKKSRSTTAFLLYNSIYGLTSTSVYSIIKYKHRRRRNDTWLHAFYKLNSLQKTAEKNNLILAPEVIVPNVSSEENAFFAGDVVKHTFLEARGGDIVEAEEIICLARAVEPIYIEYGGTVNIERVGNLFADIKLIEKLPGKERISILLWMTGIGHAPAEEKWEEYSKKSI